MLSWVHCALIASGLYQNPQGAQSVGCNLTRKLKYRCSACISYESLALNAPNVTLGMMYSFNETEYLSHYPVFINGMESPATELVGKKNVKVISEP